MLKTALVTGGTRGIGKGIVLELLKKNYNIAINYSKDDKSAEKLKNELSEYGSRICFVKADISSSDSVKKMFAELTEKFGGVDILVNNAGIAPKQMLITDISEAEIKHCIDVNIFGAVHCARAAIPYMVHNKWGRIINISSVFGITGGACEVIYSTTKAALIGFTKALSDELGPSKITVNCVAPGFIDTDMNAHLSFEDAECIKNETPLSRLGTPKDVATCVGFLSDEQAEFITGQVISISGGWLA